LSIHDLIKPCTAEVSRGICQNLPRKTVGLTDNVASWTTQMSRKNKDGICQMNNGKMQWLPP